MNHLNRHCPGLPVSCPLCHEGVEPENGWQHIRDCFGDRPDLDIHSQPEAVQPFISFIRMLLNDLPEAPQITEEPSVIQCPDCAGEFLSQFYPDHQSQCPEKRLHCQHCGQILPRRDYQDAHGDQCPRRVIQCSYSGCGVSWVQGESQKIPHQIELAGSVYHNEDGEGVRYTGEGDELPTVVLSIQHLLWRMYEAYSIPQWNLLFGFYQEGTHMMVDFTYVNADREVDITRGNDLQVEIYSESGDSLGRDVFQSRRLNYKLDDDKKGRAVHVLCLSILVCKGKNCISGWH